ncbi:MAG: XisI protein [Thiothrix sp.]|nr:MAG: XisI protein [Thiothrix sp.]
MDKKDYQQAVKNVISLYAKFRPSHGNIRLDTVFDDVQGHYALMQVGWDRGRRIRGNLVYMVLENEKVIVEYDGIEHGISADLIAQGVAEQDIVLAFLSEPNVANAA